MPISTKKKALIVLEILNNAEKPIGTWNITNILIQRGINISYATVGRILNELEEKGYLEKSEGNKGRKITRKGKEFFESKMLEERLNPNYQELREIISSNTLQKFLMVLEARESIEFSTARLAAKNATEDQVAELERIVNKREEAIKKHETIHQSDIEFHSLIAEASGNKVLSLLYQTISVQGQQSELFELIRKKTGDKYENSHRAIYEAIKNRDEELAGQRMINHIESLMNDVIEYGKKYIDKKMRL